MPIVGRENIYFEPREEMIELIISFSKKKQFSIKTNPIEVMDYIKAVDKDFYDCGYHTYKKAVDDFNKCVLKYVNVWKDENREKIIAIKYKEDVSFEDGIIIVFDYLVRHRSGSHYYRKVKNENNGDFSYYETSTLSKNEYILISHTEEKEKFLREFKNKLILLQTNFKRVFKSPVEFEKMINNNQKLIKD